MADNQTNIAIELARILTDRDTIRTKLIELGLVQSSASLDECATAIASIINRGRITATVQIGATYTIPAGFHDGTGTVSGVQGEGDFKLQSKTVTPTKSPITVTPDEGHYGLSDVKVEPIPENYNDTSSTTATATSVLAGDRFVNASGKLDTGTMPRNGTLTKVLDVATQSHTLEAGHYEGGNISIVTEERTVTPTKVQQSITPATGKVLSKVVIAPIPALYIDTTLADEEAATGAGMIVGTKAWVNGVLVEGSMADNGDVSATIDGLTSTTVTIPAGRTSGGTISLTDDIEKALKAI